MVVLSVFIAIIILIFLFLLFWKLIFLRDPKRIIPVGDNIVAPADGMIIKIIQINKKNVKIQKGFGRISALANDIADSCFIVSIFMSPLNVHINRAPISGTIKSIKHINGRFFPANKLQCALTNEKNEIVIENKKLKVKVIQIAGFIARRIECFVKENQKVNKGDKIGLINLGSQVTMILPNSVKICVKEGQKTMAGETIIAKNG